MAIFSIKVGQWLGSLLQVFVLGLFSHGKTDLPRGATRYWNYPQPYAGGLMFKLRHFSWRCRCMRERQRLAYHFPLLRFDASSI
jgi:hypothetical protein